MNPTALLAAWWLLLPLAVGRDAYFVENDLAYRRFLELMHDGTYRQIDQDHTRCAETDAGTWDQADGTVRLHATHHALRFRALLAGPLSVILDGQEKLDRLPSLAAAIRRFLASTGDAVFGPDAADEFDASPRLTVLRSGVETFARADLQSLARQIDDTTETERTGTYVFTTLRPPGAPRLLILRNAVFQSGDLPRVRREYRVPPDAPPPFYFAQVDAREYARQVGRWQAFRFLGGPE